MTDDLTTLLCLFHHQAQAQAALEDLAGAGVPQTSISLIESAASGRGQTADAEARLQQLGVPERDQRHLLEGVRGGGAIVVVESIADRVANVERIFGKHKAAKIDEAAVEPPAREVLPMAAPLVAAAAAAEAVIPVVEEELVVGKREVNRGGVRVYRRLVEVPVEQSINLREEHVAVERHPVDRPVTEQDLARQGEHTIELTETAEQAVVSKSAYVVEEVHIGKQASERTEHIHDTVRQTEVEVEEILPETERSLRSNQV